MVRHCKTLLCSWVTIDGPDSIQKAFDQPDGARRVEDEQGILASRDYFNELIKAEVDAGIPAERIVLGGFSQGGAMAIFSGLTSELKLGGIVGLSCWLLLSEKFKDLLPEGVPNKETKVFMGHGSVDPLVKTERGQQSYDKLKGTGFDVKFQLYE